MTVKEQIDDIRALDDGWNGNGAKAFTETHLVKAEEIGVSISSVREIHAILPTGRGSIQFEYTVDNLYTEIELYENMSVHLMIVKDFVVVVDKWFIERLV